MVVYRVGRTKYAGDLTGEGARLNGGRWNKKLSPCIYTSESRALAVLEYTVNANIEDIPRALSITTFEIRDSNVLRITTDQLPGDWKASPAPYSTKILGSQLLKKCEYLSIKIPSVVLEDEYNYLLNPLHKDAIKFSIVAIRDFIYDVRIKIK